MGQRGASRSAMPENRSHRMSSKSSSDLRLPARGCETRDALVDDSAMYYRTNMISSLSYSGMTTPSEPQTRWLCFSFPFMGKHLDEKCAAPWVRRFPQVAPPFLEDAVLPI